MWWFTIRYTNSQDDLFFFCFASLKRIDQSNKTETVSVSLRFHTIFFWKTHQIESTECVLLLSSGIWESVTVALRCVKHDCLYVNEIVANTNYQQHRITKKIYIYIVSSSSYLFFLFMHVPFILYKLYRFNVYASGRWRMIAQTYTQSKPCRDTVRFDAYKIYNRIEYAVVIAHIFCHRASTFISLWYTQTVFTLIYMAW